MIVVRRGAHPFLRVVGLLQKPGRQAAGSRLGDHLHFPPAESPMSQMAAVGRRMQSGTLWRSVRRPVGRTASRPLPTRINVRQQLFLTQEMAAHHLGDQPRRKSQRGLRLKNVKPVVVTTARLFTLVVRSQSSKRSRIVSFSSAAVAPLSWSIFS